MHCPQCAAVLPDNVDVCFACGKPVRGWMTGRGQAVDRKKKGRKRQGTTEVGPRPRVRLISGKLVARLGATMMMFAISLGFLAAIGYATAGKDKKMQTLDFARQARVAFEQIGNAFGG